MNLPTEDQKQMTLSRIQRHVEQLKLKRRGVEIRTSFKGQFLFLEAVKQEKSGLLGRVMGTASLKGVAKFARLDFLGPDRWRPLMSK